MLYTYHFISAFTSFPEQTRLPLPLSGNAAVIAVNLSDYVSRQILAYSQAGSGMKGDGGIGGGCRVGSVIKEMRC